MRRGSSGYFSQKFRGALYVLRIGLHPKWHDWRLATLEHCLKVRALYPAQTFFCVGRDCAWIYYCLRELGADARYLAISKRSIGSPDFARYLRQSGVAAGSGVLLDVGFRGTIIDAIRAEYPSLRAAFLVSSHPAIPSSRVFLARLGAGHVLRMVQEYELFLPKKEPRVIDYREGRIIHSTDNSEPLDGDWNRVAHERYRESLIGWLRRPRTRRFISARKLLWDDLVRGEPPQTDCAFGRAALADLAEWSQFACQPNEKALQ